MNTSRLHQICLMYWYVLHPSIRLKTLDTKYPQKSKRRRNTHVFKTVNYGVLKNLRYTISYLKGSFVKTKERQPGELKTINTTYWKIFRKLFVSVPSGFKTPLAS